MLLGTTRALSLPMSVGISARRYWRLTIVIVLLAYLRVNQTLTADSYALMRLGHPTRPLLPSSGLHTWHGAVMAWQIVP